MMQRSLFTVLFATATATLFAQAAPMELVRNGSFELLDRKVTTYDQISAAAGWNNATLGLSEVFTKDASPKTVGIPENDFGTMQPLDGDHYAGFVGWKDDVRFNPGWQDPEEIFKPGWNSFSEYLQSELIAPLKEGVEYEVTFHVALSGNSDRTILGIGAWFPRTETNYNHRKFIGDVPDVFLKDMITEKGKWTEVRGRFKALGGERYIVIGVYPYVGLESKRLIEGYDNRYAYYYVDKISLVEVISEAE